MPKELTHFYIAEVVATRLRNSTFSENTLDYREMLLLGAVFHDVLYYLPFTDPNYQRFIKIPGILHGTNGQDAFLIIRQIIRGITKIQYYEPLLAFTVGLITHIFTDATFHPFIYYSTGDYYDKDRSRRSRAIARHRRLETVLDMFVCEHYRPSFGNPKSLLLNSKVDLTSFFQQLCLLIGFEKPDVLAASIKKSYQTFFTFHNLARSRLLTFLVYYLDPILSAKIKQITSLFYYPQLKKKMAMVSGELRFKNPRTGEETHTNIENLFTESVEKSVSLCKVIDDSLNSENKEIPLLFQQFDIIADSTRLCL
nr:hypothetical protein [Desulfobacterales bacterium]